MSHKRSQTRLQPVTQASMSPACTLTLVYVHLTKIFQFCAFLRGLKCELIYLLYFKFFPKMYIIIIKSIENLIGYQDYVIFNEIRVLVRWYILYFICLEYVQQKERHNQSVECRSYMRRWLFYWFWLFLGYERRVRAFGLNRPVAGFYQSLNIHVVGIDIQMDQSYYMFQVRVSFLNLKNNLTQQGMV